MQNKMIIENAKEGLSFFDPVGCIFSLEKNLKFVTGDKAFKSKEAVMFVQ